MVTEPFRAEVLVFISIKEGVLGLILGTFALELLSTRP